MATLTTAIPAVAAEAYAYYLSKGIAPGPAAGIVATLYAGESALKTGPQVGVDPQNGGVLAPSAYGIASWGKDRQAGLKDYALKNGWDGTGDIPLTIQLDRVLNEAANAYPRTWAAIQGGVSASDMVTVFVEDYERPANPSAEIARSLPLALALAASTPVPAPAPPTAPAPIPVPPGPDAELAALAEIWQIMSKFDARAQTRLAWYIYSRTTP